MTAPSYEIRGLGLLLTWQSMPEKSGAHGHQARPLGGAAAPPEKAETAEEPGKRQELKENLGHPGRQRKVICELSEARAKVYSEKGAPIVVE